MRDSRDSTRFAPTRLGLLVAAFAVMLLAVGLLPAAPGATTDQPSYSRLFPLLANAGKQVDQGEFELFANSAPSPSAWLYVTDDTRDGSGTEYWVLSDFFPFPGPDNDNVTLRFDHLANQSHQTLGDFVDWVVNSYPFIQSANDLTIHECSVSLVD